MGGHGGLAEGAAEVMAGLSPARGGGKRTSKNLQPRQQQGVVGPTPTEAGGSSATTVPPPTNNRSMPSSPSSSQQPPPSPSSRDLSARERRGTVEARLLRDRDRELRDVRNLHAREARDVSAELARVVEAHRARVAALEEKLRRARKKIRAMARPKPTRRGGTGARELASAGAGTAGGGSDAGYGALFAHAPLSTDELLNLLAAADEEVFDARRKMQLLDFELRSTNAELTALSALREGAGSGTTGNGNAVRTDTRCVTNEEGGGGEGGSAAAACNSRAGALAPWLCPAPDGTGGAGAGASSTTTSVGLRGVARAARLAAAEAEVEALRDESLAARELAIGAQREASALRLAAHRRAADRAGEGRSREKELRRQVSAYKREAERLRSAASAAAATTAKATAKATATATVGAFFSVAGSKNGRVKKGGGGSGARTGASSAVAATAAATAEGEEDTEADRRRRGQQQLASAREESERRGRTIVALRAAKTALTEDLQRLRQEAADRENKLARALKDVGVKNNTAKALRERIAVLEAEITAPNKASAVSAAATHVVPVGGSARRDGTAPPTNVSAAAAAAASTGKESPASGCDAQTATVRDLRAERDRLRAGMRGWHASLSKKSAEISAHVAELERLEQEAAALRAAVARKDDAYRTTRKQVTDGRMDGLVFSLLLLLVCMRVCVSVCVRVFFISIVRINRLANEKTSASSGEKMHKRMPKCRDPF